MIAAVAAARSHTQLGTGATDPGGGENALVADGGGGDARRFALALAGSR